jgi:hypothetical protein
MNWRPLGAYLTSGAWQSYRPGLSFCYELPTVTLDLPVRATNQLVGVTAATVAVVAPLVALAVLLHGLTVGSMSSYPVRGRYVPSWSYIPILVCPCVEQSQSSSGYGQ